MADVIITITSAVGGAAGGLFKFLGVGTALLHVKQTYQSKIPWYEKIPALTAHLLHATSSSIAGIALVIAMAGAAVTFITPLLIVVSATAFVDNISLLYRDFMEFFHFKKEVNRLGSELKMPQEILKSQKRGIFDFTEVTPEMKVWIKKDFESKPENNELIHKFGQALPIYLEKRKEIEGIKENISTLEKELSALQPNLLKQVFERVKVTLGRETSEYLRLDANARQNAILAKTGALVSENNRLMMKSEFLRTDPSMLENQAEIFLLQEKLLKNYEPYQAFTDGIHERNLLVLKFPMRITNAVLAAAVCALSIASLTAPVTAGIAGALTAAALVVGLAGGAVGSILFLTTRNRQTNNQEKGENFYLETLGFEAQEQKKSYQETPIFKYGRQYRREDELFQTAIAKKASEGIPVEILREHSEKEAKTWTDWIKAPFEGLRNRYAPNTANESSDHRSAPKPLERRPASKMK